MPVPQAVRIMAQPTIISQLFILNHFLGMYGIVWLQVTADILTVTVRVCVFQLPEEIGRGGLTRGLFVSGVI